MKRKSKNESTEKSSFKKKFSLIEKWLEFLSNHSLLFFGICLSIYIVLFVQIISYGNFTDEHEQLTAGWFISEGLLPYKDFFSHHAPLPLFVGAIPFFIPFLPQALITQRVMMLVFQICIWLFVWYFSKPKWKLLLAFFMIFTGLTLPFFNLQMHIASTYSTFCLLAISFLLIQHIGDSVPNLKLLLISTFVLGAISFWSNISSFIGIIGIAFVFFIFNKKMLFQALFHHWKKYVLFTILWITFPIFFILNSVFSLFWWSIFTYNTQFYFPLRLAQTDSEKAYGPLFRLGHHFLVTNIDKLNDFITSTFTLVRALFGSRALIFAQKNAIEINNYYSLIFREYMKTITDFQLLIVILPICIVLILFAMKERKLSFVFFFLNFLFWFRDNELFHFGLVFLWSILFLLIIFAKSIQKNNRSVQIFILVLGCITFSPVITFRHKFLIEKRPSIDLALQSRSQEIQMQTNAEDKILIINQQIVEYFLARRLPSSPFYFSYTWTLATPQIQQSIRDTLTNETLKLVIIDPELLESFPEVLIILNQHYHPSENNLNFFVKNN